MYEIRETETSRTRTQGYTRFYQERDQCVVFFLKLSIKKTIVCCSMSNFRG